MIERMRSTTSQCAMSYKIRRTPYRVMKVWNDVPAVGGQVTFSLCVHDDRGSGHCFMEASHRLFFDTVVLSRLPMMNVYVFTSDMSPIDTCRSLSCLQAVTGAVPLLWLLESGLMGGQHCFLRLNTRVAACGHPRPRSDPSAGMSSRTTRYDSPFDQMQA